MDQQRTRSATAPPPQAARQISQQAACDGGEAIGARQEPPPPEVDSNSSSGGDGDSNDALRTTSATSGPPERSSLADRMGQSLRQLYASASCIGQRAGAVAATSGAAANGAAAMAAAAAVAAATAAHASATSSHEPNHPTGVSPATTASAAEDIVETVVDLQPPAYNNIPGTVPFYRGRSAGPPPSYDDVVNPFAAPPSYQSLFGQMREARKSSRGIWELSWRLASILLSCLKPLLSWTFVFFMIALPFAMIIIGAIYIDDCRVEHIPMFLLVGGLVGAGWIMINCCDQCQEETSPSSGSAAEHYLNTSTNYSNQSQRQRRGNDDEDADLRFISEALNGFQNSVATPTTSSVIDASQLMIDLNSNSQNRSAQLTRCNMAHQQQQQQPSSSNSNQQNEILDGSSRLKSSVCGSLLFFALVGWFIAGCIIVFRNFEPEFNNPNSLRYCNRTVYMFTFWLITSGLLVLALTVCTVIVCCVKPAVGIQRQTFGDEEYYRTNGSEPFT